MKSSLPAWPAAPWRVAAFLGGLSFTGFYFLPTWLMWPLFFLTPVVGPFMLLAVGVLALGRARSAQNSTARRRGGTGLLVAAGAFVLVAAIDVILYLAIPYIGPFVVLIAFPLHFICVVTYAMGVAAVVQTDGPVNAPRLVVPPVAGLLAGLALVFLRVGIVPHSSGVFLKAFSASGAEIRLPKAPLDPYGQKDLTDTLGVHPRSLHEPIAALGDDSLWTASRSDSGECTGHWIQRRGLSVDAPEWRRCLASEAGVVRNLTGMTMDSSRGLIIVGFDVRENLESWWMRRFDAEGRDDDRWNKASSAEMKIDRTYAALVDADGSVYVLGESGDVQLPGTFGWIRKYDREGRESSDGWTKRFPNAGEGRPTMAAIAAAVDADGNLYVLLDLYGALSIGKFDRDGRELPGWPKDLSGRKDVTLAVNPSGNLIVAGITDYPDQGWLAKFEPDGVLAWDKKLALGHLTAAYAVGFDRVGGVYAAGFKTASNEKSTDWWIKKFSSDGREFSEWDKTVVGTSIGVAPFAMRVDARDDVYIFGSGSGWRFSGSRLEHWWGWE